MEYIDELLNFNIINKDFENFVISISDRNRVGIKEKSADLIIESIEKSKNVSFENCDLKDSQFSQAKLNNVYLKGSNIENIKINKDAFANVTVDTKQALYLASLFGLKIED